MRSREKVLGIALVGSLLLSACGASKKSASRAEPRDVLVGVKIYAYQGSLPDLFAEWRSLGINTAFVSVELGSREEFRDLARREGVSVFLILPVFYDPDELRRDPGLAAMTAAGKPAKEDWVEFVCPTREDYRERKIAEVRRLVKDLDPDGVSLDFIRFFVFWEMVYPDRDPASLPETCYDQSSIESFERETGLRLPRGLTDPPARANWILKNAPRDWAEWKCRVIARMAGSLAAAAREMKPGIRVNIHTVPWRKDDFRGAIRTIAGQDLAAIGRGADFVSPMAYWHMVKRDPPWIASVVADAAAQTQARIIPSIQVDKAYIDRELSPEEFSAALREALEPPSQGVVFWNWEALAKDASKKSAVKALLKARGRP